MSPLPPTFRTLWLVTLINRVGSFVVPFLALYLTDRRGMSIAQTGAAIALYGAGATLSGLIGGALADRLGRRRTIALGLGLSAFAMVHLTLAHGVLHFLVATLLLGICADLSRPATHAAIVDTVPPAQRSRAFAYIYWAANLGFSFASFMAGWLASAHFEWLFYADAATSLVALGLVLWKLPETRPANTGVRAEPASVIVAFRDRTFLPLFATSTLVALVFMQFHSTLPLDMRAHGIDAKTFGALSALNGVLVVVLQPLTVRIAATLRPLTALALGALLTGVGFGCFGLVPTIGGYIIGICILTLGEITTAPAVPTLIADLAPDHLRGSYQGAFSMSFSLAACFGPLLGTQALAGLGSAWFWLSTLGVGLSGAVLYARLRARSSVWLESALA